MADDIRVPGRRDSNVATSTARVSLSPLRHRPLARASTIADVSSPVNRRRSSFMTQESIDRQSMRSSTDGLLLPRVTRNDLGTNNESSHLHSAPLALALLPAIGGLFFTNGSAVITDVTLLVLAAIFLNWSVRLPWEWYHSAQALHVEDPLCPTGFEQSDTITEEGSGNDEGHEPNPSASRESLPPKPDMQQSRVQESAKTELRFHELTALFACFVMPMLGAWILHAIRSQLSRPSEGLVSNYNLTIFLLGSEVRPLSHLIRMVQSRTLYLQRIVANNPFEEERIDTAKVLDLSKRLDELEAYVADKSVASPTSPTGTTPPTPSAASVQTEVRKSIQPDFDALNRAMRRYEKRATLLTMQTEARLQDLESRMADAITLAAAAERSNASSRRGSAAILLDWVCAAVVVPVQAAWAIMSLPAKVAGRAVGVVETWTEKKRKTDPKGSVKETGRVGRPLGRGVKKGS